MTRRFWAMGLTALLLTACAAPRSGFAPSRDICVSAVPVAFDAVHDKGQLVRVHRLRRLPLLPLHRIPESGVCVLVFRGPYSPGSVSGTTKGGEYAYLLVTTKHPRVLGVRLGSRP
ncbi:MAG: hypothetical protein ACYCO3_00520 [Mycobacteriales bacterium]